jgi:hypothetical protein
VAAVVRLEWVSVPAIGREEYVEPEAEEPESARLLKAVYFLATAAESPFLRELVFEFPQAHDGASILELVSARKFRAPLLSPEVWISVLPGWTADAALRLVLARKFRAALLLPTVWFLVLPDSAADAALRSALATLGLLGCYAGLAWPSSPASPPEPALWRCGESQKEELRKAAFRAGSVERASFLESLPLVKHPEEYLDWESP